MNKPTRAQQLGKQLIVAFAFLISLTAGLSAKASPVDIEVESYKQSIQNKGTGGLSLEASIGLGLTIAHCGPGFAVDVYHSIANSTDLETFKAEFKKTSPSEKCTISSIKLGMALSLLKERSAKAFETFMAMAKNRLAEELKSSESK